MPIPELACPNCGAPLKIEGHRSKTITCPYCATEVVLPAELHPPEPEASPRIVINATMADIANRPRPRSRGLFLLVAFILLVGFAVPTLISNRQSAAFRRSQVQEAQQEVVRPVMMSTPTPVPPLATPTATPQLAEAALVFGEVGIGEGMFTYARHIGVDGQGVVYVGEYEGGRIQRFDSSGKYLSQWRFGESDTILQGLAVTYQGDLYLAYNGGIGRFKGESGEFVYSLVNPEGGEFGDLAVGADGTLYSVWYEGRWGLITTLEGHREELVLFSPEGEVLRQLPNFISTQTEALALDVDLAVDGAGTIYALSDSIVFQYSPEGRFLDRIDHIGEGAGQFRSARALAVDGKGRLYLADGRDVYVYQDGNAFIDQFGGPAYINAMVVDREGGIWAVSHKQVVKFEMKK